MHRQAIFDAWVPAGHVWSVWAKPILFAQIAPGLPPARGIRVEPIQITRMPIAGGEPPARDPWRAIDLSWAPDPREFALLVVDLEGEESVHFGLALAARGYRPVPLYNACTGAHAAIDQQRIQGALREGAAVLASLLLAPDAPPAFLLDARRMKQSIRLRPGDFDNRWQVYPQDFPSADFLKARGLTRAVLIHGDRWDEPQADLAYVLCRWQDAGMRIELKNVNKPGPAVPITVRGPAWYRSAWYRVLEAVGLRRSPPWGFGRIVPEPSHG